MVLPRTALLTLIAYFSCLALANRLSLTLINRLVSDILPEDKTGNKTANVCSYNKKDVYDPQKDEEGMSYKDPRVTIKKHGWQKGVKAKLAMLGRGVIQTKMVSLQLSGPEAQSLTQAVYGIVTTKVPEKCFPLLKEALSVSFSGDGKKDMALLKLHKKNLTMVLNQELPKGCGADRPVPDSREDREIKRVQQKLWFLLRGYWSLYAPFTIDDRFVLSARNLDEGRVLRNDLRIRQVWFFGKMHMTHETALSVNAQLRASQLATSEEDRLKGQIKRIFMLQAMRDAHLEFIELDAIGSCVSAMKYDPDHMFAQLSGFLSSNYRATLMFRERHWQSQVKGVSHFFQHPILSVKKYTTRFSRQWSRARPVEKISMVITPLIKVATLAGMVMGAVTGGTTTFTVLFADVMVDCGIQIGVATVPLIEYMVTEAVGVTLKPLKAYMIEQGSVCLFTEMTLLQAQFDNFMGTVPHSMAFAEVRSQLDVMVENIMNNDKVREQLELIRNEPTKVDDELTAEAHEALKEGVEAEVRGYVQNMVSEGFLQDIGPSIRDEFVRRHADQDPTFGWLTWEQWEMYRSSEFGQGRSLSVDTRYNNKMLRYGGDCKTPSSWEWEGKVIDTDRKIPGRAQQLTVEIDKANIDSTDEVEVVSIDKANTNSMKLVSLTSEVKSHMCIRDAEAFRRSQAGWLSWHDWADYRKSGSATKLQGKLIYLDAWLHPTRCPNIINSNPCLSHITDGTRKHKVVKTHMKVLGLGTRRVDVQPAEADACSFSLETKVKDCLRVHDPDAWDKFTKDTAHREKEKAWQSGKLHAAGSIFDDVVAKVQGLGEASQAQKDAAAREVMKAECGPECEFQTEDLMATGPEDKTEQEIQELQNEVEEGGGPRAKPSSVAGAVAVAVGVAVGVLY